MKLLTRECSTIRANPLLDVQSHHGSSQDPLVRNQPRKSKNDPIVSPATLIHANPEYAHVRLQSGVETTVNLRDIAQHPDTVERDDDSVPNVETDTMNSQGPIDEPSSVVDQSEKSAMPKEPLMDNVEVTDTPPTESINLRRTTRVSRPPKRLDNYVMG